MPKSIDMSLNMFTIIGITPPSYGVVSDVVYFFPLGRIIYDASYFHPCTIIIS